MTVNFLLLTIGIVLLWFPRRWMLRGVTFLRRRRRSAETQRIVEPWREREPGDPRVNFRTEFKKFRNYVDLLRGAAGSLVLMGGMGLAPAIAVAPGAPKTMAWQVMGVRAAILLVGLLLQTLRWDKGRVTFYPPIFYIAGLSVGLCDVRGAAFAFAMIWAINPALTSPSAFLSVYALLLIVFGHFFAWRGDPRAAYAAVLSFLPVLLSLLTKRPLVIFARKSTR